MYPAVLRQAGDSLGKACTQQPCPALCHRGPDPGLGFPYVNEASLEAWRLRGPCVHFYKLVRNPRTSGLGLTDHLYH